MYPLNPRKPSWLKATIPGGTGYEATRALIKGQSLHTVCEEAQCPNLGECWARGTATIMILGDICTRACGFCAVKTGRPTELDKDEPRRVAENVAASKLRHVVITSVARDELDDGGAQIWAETVTAVRAASPRTKIEILTSDFLGKKSAWKTVFDSKPDIFSHNCETVERLVPQVRSVARWDRTLEMLAASRKAGLATKSGMMLGLGESDAEIEAALVAMRGAGVQILTLGQYLQPTPKHLPVAEYVTPEKFAHWKTWGLDLGFTVVESGPLVRSSYHADEQSDRFSMLGK